MIQPRSGYVIPVKLNKIVPEANSSAYFTKTLNEYFQKSLDTGSGNSLVIILKTFWLQKGDIEDMSDKNIETKFTLITGDEGVCFAEFETFCLKDGNYRALTKLDHIFLTSAYRSRKIKDFILQPFDSLIKKIATINIETHLSKKRNISWNEIHSAYSKRFDLPVLTQRGSQKGVFLAFNDFENNITTHPDFIFKQSKLSDDVYIKNNNKEELLTDFWGFFDGNNYYIKIGYNFFKLHWQNNTFDLYGSKYITNIIRQYGYSGSSFAPPFNITTGSMKMEYKPFQLDMETGEVY